MTTYWFRGMTYRSLEDAVPLLVALGDNPQLYADYISGQMKLIEHIIVWGDLTTARETFELTCQIIAAVRSATGDSLYGGK